MSSTNSLSHCIAKRNVISLPMKRQILILFLLMGSVFTIYHLAFFNPTISQQDTLHVLKRESRLGLEPIELDAILNNKFQIERWNGSWVSDTEFIYSDRSGALSLLNVQSGQSRIIVPARIMQSPFPVFKSWLSPDHSWVLLAFRPQKLFRHSFIALYDVYNVQSEQRIHLGPGPDVSPNSINSQLPLQYVTWAGPSSNALAFVFENNIYYKASPTSEAITVTTTGIPGVIFNGNCDWVYEEEIISQSGAIWFSPDAKHLAWIEFNDTDTDIMNIEFYGRPGSLQFQYPIHSQLRYPKPGRQNPYVNVYAANIDRLVQLGRKASTFLLEPPISIRNQERIIYRVKWATNNEVSLTWETRHQNYSVVSICSMNNAVCKDSLIVTQPGGWMELDSDPIFKSNGREFAMILSADGYPHVNIINRDTNQRVPITFGRITVTTIYHWDEVNHLIYFRATRKDAPGERHLYTVTDFNSDRPGSVTCISCSVINNQGGRCGYNSFEFSHKKTYYTMSCKGPHVPQDYLYQTNQTHQRMAVLVTNNMLSKQLSQKRLPKISTVDIPIDGGRFVAKVRLYLPPDFDRQNKYPLLINVYAGPNSQQVNDKFKIDWGTYLTTTENIIYGIIDGRGSGFRGDELLHEIYYKFGKPEVQDQIDVTKQLVDLYDFIDADNVAIWGWSYGGFVASSVLARDDENIFKCAVAVAPVTNWIHYDTMYTERYMGLPTDKDNLAGYKDSDVTSKALKFKGKQFLIVHGTADDNVHYQQSMLLARALEEADVIFQQISYPDEGHGLIGLRPHFYHSISNFVLNDCFGRNTLFQKK